MLLKRRRKKSLYVFSRNCNITVNSSELILIKPCANLSRVQRYFSFLHPNSTPRNPNIANTSFINATYQLNRRNQMHPSRLLNSFHRRSRERRKYSVGSFSLRVRGGERSRERIRVLLVKGQPEASRVRHTSLPLSLPLSPRARLLL